MKHLLVALTLILATPLFARTPEGSNLAHDFTRADSFRMPGHPIDDAIDDEGNDEGNDEGPDDGIRTACCLPGGGCADAIQPDDCVADGGVAFGPCSTCEETLCPTNDACIGAEGSCTTPHPTPGCNSVFCCEQICAVDPYCCEVQWDADCAATVCIDIQIVVDCCLPDGGCLSFTTPGACRDVGGVAENFGSCADDFDGDGIDDGCGCGEPCCDPADEPGQPGALKQCLGTSASCCANGDWQCDNPDGSSSCEAAGTVCDPCDGFVYEPCSVAGCPQGQVCDTVNTCVASFCSCDPATGSIICTADCGGGLCVPES